MTGYIKVDVKTEIDENGNISPIGIIWKEKMYKIVRVIHVSQTEDKVLRYTILIGGQQRQLYCNGCSWRISAPPKKQQGET